MAESNRKMIYVDYNATCPMAREVQKSVTHAMEHLWGNPSSNNVFGKEAKASIDESRLNVANMINCNPEDVIFASGGTEANNMVINSVLETFEKRKNEFQNIKNVRPHIITSTIEHDSIKLPLKNLQKANRADISFVSANSTTGCVNVDDLFEKIQLNTCLISIMLANNETGVVQPVKEVGEKLEILNKTRSLKILFHTDAAQVVGKYKIDVKDLLVDYLTIVGHKFYGPRNGALFVKNLNENEFKCMIFGGGQERGYRPGTENTPMIVGLGKASELVNENLLAYQNHFYDVRDYFENQLKASVENVVVHFEMSKRLPNTSSVAFLSFQGTGASLLKLCTSFCASTSAACHAHGTSVSAVLLSSGVELECAKRTIRFSFGRETTKQDIDVVVDQLKNIILKQVSV